MHRLLRPVMRESYGLIVCGVNHTRKRAGSQKMPEWCRLLSSRLSHRNSVCPSVRHMGGSVKNGAR